MTKGEELQKRWKEKILFLDIAEIKLKKLYLNKEISKLRRDKIQSIINKLWINIWDYHPDINNEQKKMFKEFLK